MLIALHYGMGKPTKTFRLSSQALDKLDALHDYTGSTHTAIVENALAVYAAFLEHGLPLPTDQPKAADAAPRSRRARRTEEHATTQDRCTYIRGDQGHRFPFPVASIPKRARDACPCGSGKSFNNCHPREYHHALELGLTHRD